MTNAIEKELIKEYKVTGVRPLAGDRKTVQDDPERHVYSGDDLDETIMEGLFSSSDEYKWWLDDLDQSEWWSDAPLVYVLTEDGQKVIYEVHFDEHDNLVLGSVDSTTSAPSPDTLKR